MTKRAQRIEAALDSWIPPSIQRAVATALLLGALAKLGVNVGQVQGTADQAALTLSSIEATVTNAMERSYQERRKTWTLTNDLKRIENKLDQLLEAHK